MKLKSARAKGKLFERWFSERLRHIGLDDHARPEIGSGSGRHKGDIATKLPITFELKNTKNFSARAYLKQAEDAAMGYQEACVLWKPPSEPMENYKVFMSASLFEKLLKAFFRN